MKQILIITLLVGLTVQTFSQEINWMSIEEMEQIQKTNPKKVLIDIYTDWCGWCKRLDATTFKDPKIIAYLNKNFHCVKLDGEERDVVTYKGVEFKFVPTGRRGYHQLASGFMNGRISYPTLTVLDENLDILQVFKGYQQPEDFLPILVFLGDEIYKEKDWETFLTEFNTSN